MCRVKRHKSLMATATSTATTMHCIRGRLQRGPALKIASRVGGLPARYRAGSNPIGKPQIPYSDGSELTWRQKFEVFIDFLINQCSANERGDFMNDAPRPCTLNDQSDRSRLYLAGVPIKIVVDQMTAKPLQIDALAHNLAADQGIREEGY
jgi:hypothetical protein